MSPRKSEFAGKAATIEDADFERAARRLGCEIAAIRAVAKVESGGRHGFLKDKRPKILFESRYFHNLTDGRFDSSHPDISTPKWERNYVGGSGEYDRLAKAIALEREAALKSASWGMFQIMGNNHQVCGFADVENFVESQLDSEGAHLDAFVAFVISNHLDDELRDRRWADFARGYNGPGYKQNRYDEKMAQAYAEFAGGRIAPSVLDIQRALNQHGANLELDGQTGPKTREAIRAFQREAGLPVDGIAGPMTRAALGLGETHDAITTSAEFNA